MEKGIFMPFLPVLALSSYFFLPHGYMMGTAFQLSSYSYPRPAKNKQTKKSRRKSDARHMCPFLSQNKNFPKSPADFSSHLFASGDVISYHQQQEELGRQVSNLGI